MRQRFRLQLPSGTLELGRKTLIMGILNVTPDSFYDGGAYLRPDEAVKHGLQLEDQGADLVDVGGESTRPDRPGSVSAADEIRRVVPVIEQLARRLTVPISVDTYKSEVARRAVAAGASLVNDISGLRFDSHMAACAARGWRRHGAHAQPRHPAAAPWTACTQAAPAVGAGGLAAFDGESSSGRNSQKSDRPGPRTGIRQGRGKTTWWCCGDWRC